jgi:S1-C subfamily serine protease
MREQLQALTPPLKGVMITDVDPESSATRKGLVQGMILLSLNGQPTPCQPIGKVIVSSWNPA